MDAQMVVSLSGQMVSPVNVFVSEYRREVGSMNSRRKVGILTALVCGPSGQTELVRESADEATRASCR